MAKPLKGSNPGYRLVKSPEGYTKVPDLHAPKVPAEMATKVETVLPPPDDQALNKLRDKYKDKMGLDGIGNFSDGRAWVVRDEKVWFIKADGTDLSRERYDVAYSFSGGRAFVKRDGQAWYIDLNGNRITDV
ncbi:MAG: WG repeat-containing protein [Patescibacteria group bacterium]